MIGESFASLKVQQLVHGRYGKMNKEEKCCICIYVNINELSVIDYRN